MAETNTTPPIERQSLLLDTCVSSAKFEVLLRVMVRKGDVARAHVSGSSDSGAELVLLLHDRVAKSFVCAVGPFEVKLELEVGEPGVVKLAWRVPVGVGLACIHAKTTVTEYATLKLWRPS
jgi:hypothetical protein